MARALWPQRLPQPSHTSVKRHVGAPAFKAAGAGLWKPCVLGKQRRAPFSSTGHTVSAPLELVHMDLCGPMPVPSLGGTRYIATFVDDYTKYSLVRCVEHKYDIPDVVEDMLTALAARRRSPVRAVRTDRGTEYLNKHTQH